MSVLMLLSDCLKVYATDGTDVICRGRLAYLFTNPNNVPFSSLFQHMLVSFQVQMYSLL